MADSITVNGTIASDPRHVTTSEGLEITSFRLASSQRYFDRKRAAFVDGETNWFSEASQHLGKLPKRLDRLLSQHADSSFVLESAENWRNGRDRDF